MMKCVIIDDEPLARKIIREYIEEVSYLELVGETDSPLKALSMIQEEEVDLVFLDIQMPDMNGIDFLKTLVRQPKVIITSAFSEYALDGYELNVTDYLLKPISFDRFLKACNKVMGLLEQRITPQRDFLFVKCDEAYERILYADILFIESADNFVYIHTLQKKYMVWLTLKHVLEQLPADQFIKVHRSFVIAINKVEQIKHNHLLFGDHEIPVSKQHKNEVMRKVLQGSLLRR